MLAVRSTEQYSHRHKALSDGVLSSFPKSAFDGLVLRGLTSTVLNQHPSDNFCQTLDKNKSWPSSPTDSSIGTRVV